MKTQKEKKPILLLEGELLFEKGKRIPRSEVSIRILDITHIDRQSIILTELIEELTIKKKQTRIPFKIYGPVPDASNSYIVAAFITTEKKSKGKKTRYRTTQSIPVFRDGYPEVVEVPLTKIG